jgi:hypothetical protein
MTPAFSPARCVPEGHRLLRPRDPHHASRLPSVPFRSCRQRGQKHLHGKARRCGQPRRAQGARNGQGRRREEPQSRLRPPAPLPELLPRRPQAGQGTGRHRRDRFRPGVLERRRHLVPRQASRRHERPHVPAATTGTSSPGSAATTSTSSTSTTSTSPTGSSAAIAGIRAQGMGGRQQRVDRKWGQIYDHHAVRVHLRQRCPRQQPVPPPGRCLECDVREEFTGTKGKVYLDNSGKLLRQRPQGRTRSGSTAPSGKCSLATLKKARSRQAQFGGDPDPYQVEHDTLQAAIRENTPLNNAYYGAESTMTALLGRMATYSAARKSEVGRGP